MRAIEYGPRRGCLAAALALCVASTAAGETSWLRASYRGLVMEEATYASVRESPLNPGNRVLEVASLSNRLYLDLDLKVGVGSRLDVVLRDRLIHLMDDRGRDDTWNTVEDGFVALRPAPGVAIEAGKKNMREGVGYAFNPVDFLATSSRLNGQNPDPAAQKQNRPGNYLVAAQAQLAGLTVSGVYSPRLAGCAGSGINQLPQYLLKAHAVVGGHDVAVYAYRGTRWKGGLAWDVVAGQATELHAEATLQRGSDALVPVAGGTLPSFGARDGAETLVLRALAGGHYTFANGINVIAEYYYNAAGYTRGEFDRYGETVEAASLAPQQAGIILGQALQSVDSAQGRHFAFVRISGARLPARFEAAAFVVVNLRDGSQLVSAELARGFKNLALGISYDGFRGPSRSGFGILPIGYDVRIHFKFFY